DQTSQADTPGGPITGNRVVPCSWQKTPQGGPISVAGDNLHAAAHPTDPTVRRAESAWSLGTTSVTDSNPQLVGVGSLSTASGRASPRLGPRKKQIRSISISKRLIYLGAPLRNRTVRKRFTAGAATAHWRPPPLPSATSSPGRCGR